VEIKCPHCSGDIHIEAGLRLPPETSVRWAITPKPGEMLSADTVGGTLTDVRKLFRSLGRELGVTTETLVEKIEMNGETIVFHLRVINAPKEVRQRIAALTGAAS
jgi:hypothetical protein